MKLLRGKACQSALQRGNGKRLTVMGEVLMDGFSDRGSIPLSEGLICPEFRDLAQNILFYFNRFSVTVVMRFCTENIRMPHNILD